MQSRTPARSVLSERLIDAIQMQNRAATPTGWASRQMGAFERVGVKTRRPLHEHAMVRMIDGWAEYADAHYEQFDSLIGEDYVLGPAWQAQGEAFRTLLNGELGDLDGGTMDGAILDIMRVNGIDTRNL
jgi:hypothetical protein